MKLRGVARAVKRTCASANAGDTGSTPESGRSRAEGNGNPLQYFVWEIPWTEEPGSVESLGSQKSQTQLND